MIISQPPVGVGEATGEPGAGDGSNRNRGDHQSRLEARQPEVRLDEEQGAGDDANVIAEQQAAEACDRRRQHHRALGASRLHLDDRVHSQANLIA